MPSEPRKVRDERLCIWCGGEYKRSDDGASECYCAFCEEGLTEDPKGAARLQWLREKLQGHSPPGTDWGQGRNEPWPPTFPVHSRPTRPS